MQFAGRPSWSLSVRDDDQLNLALFVRDAAGLVIESEDVPPALAVPPERSDVLAGADLVAVGRDWLDWWRSLVALVLDQDRVQAGSGEDLGARAARLHGRRDAVGSPTDDFAGLAHAPALRRACVALSDAAIAANVTAEDASSHEWVTATDPRRIVGEVAAAHGLDPNTLAGTVVLVPTEGIWWHRVEPGAVIAARHAPAGPVIRAALEPTRAPGR